MDYYAVTNAIERLKKKGIIARVQKESKISKEREATKDSRTFIEVTKDLIVKTGKNKTVNIKGGRGYLDGASGSKEKCVIFYNRIPYKVPIDTDQYRVVGS